MGILKNAKMVVSEVKKGVKQTKRRISRRKYIESKRQLHIDEPVREDKELAAFIKENIISKKPEFPEYDKASFESTMAELKKEVEEREKELEEENISVPDHETLALCIDVLGIDRPEAEQFEQEYTSEKALKIIAERIDIMRSKIRHKEFTHFQTTEMNKLLQVAPYVDVFRSIKHVYIINGYARSGKDTFIKLFNTAMKNGSDNNPVVSISSVQGIKDIATSFFGYDEKRKDDKDRKFLADFKELTSNYCDFSMNYVMREIIAADIKGAKYIFIHVREPGEIKRTKERVGEIIFPHFSETVTMFDYDMTLLMRARKFYDVKTVFIDNYRVKNKVTNNNSDLDVEKYDYDIRINNNGTLEDLELEARRMAVREISGF